MIKNLHKKLDSTDEDFQPVSMYEATRDDVSEALVKTESKARKSGKLGIREFISFATQVWPP